jgi:hypothetical protein
MYAALTWGNDKDYGFVQRITTHKFLDLAMLQLYPNDDKVHYFELAKEAPKKGDRVYWYEFEHMKSMKTRVVKGKYLYARGGYFFFERSPRAGASGGCFFNDKGRVLGVTTWGFDDENDGAAAGLFGITK